jgi:ribonucleoside-diphosphate reductase alpha chain
MRVSQRLESTIGSTPQSELRVRRFFTTEGVDPYDEVEWDVRDAIIQNYRTGEVAFEQRGVEIPMRWSQNATNIVSQKYFRGSLGSPQRERSVRQMIDRVANRYAEEGAARGYFSNEDEVAIFRDELKHLLVTQKAAFNSPVWFNVGWRPPGMEQASACFILSVEDEMSSILNWYVEEGTIFKGGSGSGINLSPIRSSKERLHSGGTASGPVSFMRGADASAGTIKSGGATRRAAKMVVLNVDHPDIRDFIWCKALEEHKARALRAAGFDMDLDGSDSHSIQYQNANNSVRVTDEFMEAVLEDRPWELKAVTTGETTETVQAREILREIAQAAWECADPGMQYDTTINDWHTCPNTGRINASNPCSEYVHLDDSSCNLASLNLMKFLDDEDNLDVKAFTHAVEIMFLAQEISVGFASYPTEKIAETSRRFRQLGQGYANLGALLMAQGLPYDSDEGRAWAAAITALMTGHCYATSARIAKRVGSFEGYDENREPMLRVMHKHRDAARSIPDDLAPPSLVDAARTAWEEAVALGQHHGYRNAQATVLAPTGCLVGGSLVPTERGLVRLRSLGDPTGERWQDLGVDVNTDEGPRTACSSM